MRTVPDDEPIPGQMTLDECIEVAEHGLDGKDAVPGAVSAKPPAGGAHRRPLTVAEAVRRMMQKGNPQ